ncbi:MAG: hypothetical protein M1830_004467 [Pleopsidium flavum]|nr:MAG: hypothetical protein M1830_004467 [Pleopsidium flavum]
MSKKQFKSQASSSRAVSGAFASRGQGFSGLGGPAVVGLGLTSSSSSPLSYVAEPPDLSRISEPNVVVALKNLLKKDSTTKAKALEDLQSYVLSTGVEEQVVEDALLEAWGHIAVSCGKRIARHMPNLVGAWLAGLHDNDRPVAKAAQDSFRHVFPTQHKMRAVWKVYQSPILEYSRDAILKETVQSLSDERTVSPDDAEAKYARVVGTNISVITDSLAELSTEETTKEHGLYVKLFNDTKLWKFSSHHDAFVRRAVYKLLHVVVSGQRAAVDFGILSTTILAEALNIDQSGSAYDYSDVLYVLTKTKSEVWTDLYTGKKPAVKGLRQFLKKGSQGGPHGYWTNVERILCYIPSSIIAPTWAGDGEQLLVAKELLEALHDGIIKEPRVNLPVAWNTYVATAARVSTMLIEEQDRQRLLQAAIAPLFEHFILPKQELSRWSIGVSPALATGIIVKAFQNTIKLGGYQLLEQELQRCAESLIEHIKTSHPEQSRDYAKSQDAVAAEANRWFSLTAEVSRDASEIVKQILIEPSVSLVEGAMEVVKARNGKPYGAAATIEAAMRLLPSVLMANANALEAMTKFLNEDVPSLILSPSSPYLITALCAFEGRPRFEKARDAVAQALLRAPDSPARNAALKRVVTTSALQNSAHSIELDEVILGTLRKAMKGHEQSWGLVIAVLDSSMTPHPLTDQLLAAMTESLSVDLETSPALHGLDLATKHNGKAIRKFSTTADGSKLLSRLLFLIESPIDDIAHQAATVSVAVESSLSNDKGLSHVSRSMIEIINKELDGAGPTSLSVDSLIDQASKILQQIPSADRSVTVAQLLPDSAQWSIVSKPFLKIPPNLALAITSPMGGAVYAVDRVDAKTDLQAALEISRDLNGYAPALRMAIYVSRLIEESDIFEHVSIKQRTEIVSYLSLLVNLASDNLGLQGANHLWNEYTPEVDDEMARFISRTQALIARWLETANSSDLRSTAETEFLGAAGHRFLEGSSGLSANAYNNARAFSVLQSELLESNGTTTEMALEESLLKDFRRGSDVFLATALLTGLKVRKESMKLCNETVADLTGLNITQNDAEGLRQLIIINTIIQNQDGIADGIPQQRLVFLIKHLLSNLGQSIPSSPVIAEIFKVFTVVLPIIKGIYGSHWTEILRSITTVWSQKPSSNDEELPIVHASLRLYATVRSLVGDEDGNDDLEDAWKESLSASSNGLINLLKRPQAVSDDANQPLRMVNELLARQIAKVPIEHLEDPSELYPLLYVDSRSIQETAYGVLHEHIPSEQEQTSLEVALSKMDARLPDELLSLILEAPTAESLADATFERTMPLHLRGYLLSWKLVFDHFTNASYKVKADYVENIKKGTYLVGLLDFTFDFLGHSMNKPADASRFDIISYTPDMEESPQKDAQWLLIHLYYLALRHLPTLSRTWWMACQNRQTVLAVEVWTEKYISPLIIAAELTTVSDWIPTQATDSQALTIKVNQKAKEITAGYEVDDQTMQIAIKLPPTYPLHQATVEGINRVGVDEKKWRSWLINTQGVITFSVSSPASLHFSLVSVHSYRINLDL